MGGKKFRSKMRYYGQRTFEATAASVINVYSGTRANLESEGGTFLLHSLSLFEVIIYNQHTALEFSEYFKMSILPSLTNEYIVYSEEGHTEGNTPTFLYPLLQKQRRI